MTKKTEKYYGPHKVMGATFVDKYTSPMGTPVVEIILENGEKVIVSQKGYDALSTESAIDFTALFDLKKKIIEDVFIKFAAEYDLRGAEAELLLKYLGEKMSNVFDKASHMLWTDGDAESWVPSSNFMHVRSILEADKVLKKYDDKTTKKDSK